MVLREASRWSAERNVAMRTCDEPVLSRSAPDDFARALYSAAAGCGMRASLAAAERSDRLFTVAASATDTVPFRLRLCDQPAGGGVIVCPPLHWHRDHGASPFLAPRPGPRGGTDDVLPSVAVIPESACRVSGVDTNCPRDTAHVLALEFGTRWEKDMLLAFP